MRRFLDELHSDGIIIRELRTDPERSLTKAARNVGAERGVSSNSTGAA